MPLNYALVGLMLFAGVAHAEHVLSIADNQRARCAISQQTLNRIFIEGDRIAEVRGIEGEYTLHQDNEAGEIYLRPQTTHRLSLFLSTVQHKHYQLTLRPVSSDAQTVHLVPTEAALTPARTAPFEQAVLTFMKAFAARDAQASSKHPPQATPDVSSPLHLSLVKPLTFLLPPELSAERVITVVKKPFVGEMYRLEDHSASPMTLDITMFYQADVMALALRATVIPAHGHTTLYVMRSFHD